MCPNSAKAQLFSYNEQETPQIKFGIVGGYNYSNGKDIASSNYTFDPINSFHIGVSADLHLIKRFSIEPTFLISQKGFTFSNNIQSFGYKLDYVSFQILGKIHLTKSIKLLLGSETARLSNVTSIQNQLIDPSIFTEQDYTILGGIELSLFEKLSIHAKYNHSINSLADFVNTDENGNPIGTSDFRNRLVMIGATFYPFRFTMQW